MNRTNGGIELSEESTACEDPHYVYMGSLGIEMAVPEWEAALTAIILSLIILLTVVGNILVILSVFTYKPLRIVQNFFIVSLAVADLTVALLVMPFNVAYSILGRWEFGIHACKMWLTCDVLCCTASILNLCAIALDRFWAITDPINYAQKRTLKRVLILIGGVWVLSLIISSPPLIGWNDWPQNFSNDTPCQLTSQQGYVVYSSLGSFYIPLIIMTIVYIQIFIATRRRLRERAMASKINTIMSKDNNAASAQSAKQPPRQPDQDSVSSETNHNEHQVEGSEKTNRETKNKKHKKKKKKSSGNNEKTKKNFLTPILPAEDSVTDNPENSSGSNQRKNSLTTIEYGFKATDTSVLTTTTTTTTTSPNSRNASQKDHTTTAVHVVVSSQPAPTPIIKKPGAVYQFIEEKQRISLSKERRAARTLGIIMGVFVVCWLPFFLMYVILPFCPSCCATKRLINFITWLGYINSALNPIIYTIFNLEYRRAFKKLLGIKP